MKKSLCDKSKYKEPYKYTGFLIWVIGNVLSQNTEDVFAGNKKILFNHFMVLASLFWLLEAKGRVNQRTLATYTHLREITISTIIKKLVVEKYVSVVVDKDDRRSKSLLITEKGLTVLTSLLDQIVEKEDKLKTPELSGLNNKLTSLLKMVSLENL
jgi:DNA-binding MarR family transcriptional regulator